MNVWVECAQPNFPPQIVFSPDDGITIVAIDEINQRAYTTINFSSTSQQTSFALKHIQYAIPDSPQSKYYVQLLVYSPTNYCMYGTYWKYGGVNFNIFPSHWTNGTFFEVRNYLDFNSEMIHSSNSSIEEDYWYSTAKCQPDTGGIYPCQEIYFKKNTDIPLRSIQVIHRRFDIVRMTTEYTMVSIGKPDEKYFESIPKNWSTACRDVMLGVLYNPETSTLLLNQSIQIQIWLPTPPHRINGSDSVRIQWKSSECTDCLVMSPKELVFNIDNFHKRQLLTITRVKKGPEQILVPQFHGGGFELVPADNYILMIN